MVDRRTNIFCGEIWMREMENKGRGKDRRKDEKKDEITEEEGYIRRQMEEYRKRK